MTSAGAADDPLPLLRAGRLRDPATGRLLERTFPCTVIEPSLDGQEADLLAPLRLPAPLVVVSDEKTREVLGRRVERALPAGTRSITLERPRADLATALRLARETGGAGALIAVGSGTLNDLVKHAAASTGRPYVVFATAPSMNGYVTGTASLAARGLKSTLPAVPPRMALFDLAVMGAAPLEMIRAGLGDVLCRTTAQVDWLLAHLLTDAAYDERPFFLQAADESLLLDAAGDLAHRDPQAIECLTRLIVLSGIGMTLAGSSAPASQGEHLISHYLDTFCPDHPGSLHGAQVGVAMLTMSRLQERLLALPEPPAVRPEPIEEAAFTMRFGRLAAACLGAARAKALDGGRTALLNRRLAEGWPTFVHLLSGMLVAPGRLQHALRAAGAATTPEGLGFERTFYLQAVRHARFLRERYTALDLAAQADVLEGFIDEEERG